MGAAQSGPEVSRPRRLAALRATNLSCRYSPDQPNRNVGRYFAEVPPESMPPSSLPSSFAAAPIDFES